MIKFDRYPWRSNYQWEISDRALKMAESKPERDAKKLREKLPLLAEQIEGGKVENFDGDAVRAERIKNKNDSTAEWRRKLAADWKRGRKWFYSLDEKLQKEIIERWEGNRYRPKTPVYFLGLLDIMTGEQAKRLALIAEEDEKRRQANADKQLSLI